MAMFRCLKNHVKIKIETWNFANLLEVVQTDGKKNLKVNRYREGGFLEPPFSNKLSCDICMYHSAGKRDRFFLLLPPNRPKAAAEGSGLRLLAYPKTGRGPLPKAAARGRSPPLVVTWNIEVIKVLFKNLPALLYKISTIWQKWPCSGVLKTMLK